MNVDLPLVFEQICPEEILGGGAPPGAQAAYGYREHMFVRLEMGADGRGQKSAIFRAATPHRAGPREDHTSSFVAIRSTTAVVNWVVPAPPPRSGVFTPAATVSSAAS